MTTGEKITTCRKEIGLTQSELAEELGVSRQAVSRWESDAAFPETDKLLKMSKLFSCSVDWLLKYDEEERGETEEDNSAKNSADFLNNLKSWHFEYKSKKTVGKLPLVHINIGFGRTAKGFFAVGLKSMGIFSLGLLSLGVVSLGVISAGIISLASAGLGILSLGAIALGLFSLGGVAVGILTFGGLAVGLFAYGGCAVGGFAFGGAAYGSYIAIGDYASGGIALGGTYANGWNYSATITDFKANEQEIYSAFNSVPQIFGVFTNWCKSLFDAIMQGKIALGGITV